MLSAPAAWGGLLVDAGALTEGADVSTAVAGVTLSAPGSTPTTVSVKWGAFTTGAPAYDWFTGGRPLRATFDSTVPSVSVTFGLGGAGGPGPFVGWSGSVLAFDAADLPVDSETMAFNAEGDFVITVTGAIKYIQATFLAYSGPENPTSMDFAGLTRIEAVPEPAAWVSGLAMLGAGLAGLRLHRRPTGSP